MDKDINVFNILSNVYKKTIGSELAETKVSSTATTDMYKELCESLLQIIEDRHVLKDNEYLTKSYSFLGNVGKWKYSIELKPAVIDNTKQYVLTNEDKKILESHGITDDFNGCIGISNIDDDILIIRTSETSWNCLCGREWHYNLKTKEWNLSRMN